jgi:Endosomal/lysosomal potassium channel TMEM175
MGANRIEAFSDGVIAIIVTIMVVELKLPPNGSPQSLAKVAPTVGDRGEQASLPCRSSSAKSRSIEDRWNGSTQIRPIRAYFCS